LITRDVEDERGKEGMKEREKGRRRELISVEGEET